MCPQKFSVIQMYSIEHVTYFADWHPVLSFTRFCADDHGPSPSTTSLIVSAGRLSLEVTPVTHRTKEVVTPIEEMWRQLWRAGKPRGIRDCTVLGLNCLRLSQSVSDRTISPSSASVCRPRITAVRRLSASWPSARFECTFLTASTT